MSSNESTSNIQRGKKECNYLRAESNKRTKKLIDIILGVEMRIKHGIKTQLAMHDHEIFEKFVETQKSFDLIFELMEQSNSIMEDISGKLQSISTSVDKSISEQENLHKKVEKWENCLPTDKVRPAAATGLREFVGEKSRNIRCRDIRPHQEPKSRFGHKFVRPVVSQSDALVKSVSIDVLNPSRCVKEKKLRTGRCDGIFTSSDASSHGSPDSNLSKIVNEGSKEFGLLSNGSDEEISSSLKDWWNEDENENSGQCILEPIYQEEQAQQEAEVDVITAPYGPQNRGRHGGLIIECSEKKTTEIILGKDDCIVASVTYETFSEACVEQPNLPVAKPTVGGFGKFRRGNPTPAQSSITKPKDTAYHSVAGTIERQGKALFSAVDCEDPILPGVLKPGSFFGKGCYTKVVPTAGLCSPPTEQRSNYSNERTFSDQKFACKLNSNDFGGKSGHPSRKPGPRIGGNMGKFNMKKAQQTGKKFTL